MRRIEPGLRTSSRDGKAQARNHRTPADRIRWSRRERIALPVHHAEVAGIALPVRFSPRLWMIGVEDREGTVLAARFRMEPPRVTGGRHVTGGAAGVDAIPPFSGKALIQQTRHRDLDEIGVAEVRLPVGKRQFESFDSGVEVVRGFVPHPLQVNPFENLQRHVQGRPLAPGSAGIHIVALVGDARRRFDPNRERGEVLVGQQAPLPRMKIGDLPGNFALVDQVARGPDARFPITPCPPFGGDHAPEGVRQVLLEEYFPDLRNTTPGVEDRRRRRLTHLLSGREGVELIVDGVAVFGEVQGRLHHLLEAHAAEARQRHEPGIGSRRGDGPQNSRGQVAAVVFLEVADARPFWPASESADGFNSCAPGRTVYYRRNTAKVGEPGLKHVDTDADGDACIGGVASPFEDADPAHRREVMDR